MNNTISIASRFNGPPDSGNGGYTCGLIAQFIEGPAKVRLQVPPPLDKVLRVEPDSEGAVKVYDEATLVATGMEAQIAIDPPTPPTFEQAVTASASYVGFKDHLYPGCFVCGPDREAGDGLCLFPGPVVPNDWSLQACPWQPSPDLLDDKGNVRAEFVWAALDCPSYFGVAGNKFRRVLLGELLVHIEKSVPGRDRLIVICWPIGIEGRKSLGGSAIATSAGEILAYAQGTWIELNQPD